MSEELKPCPFCGGKATETRRAGCDEELHFTVCLTCGAGGPLLSKYDGEEGSDCIEWNTRAESPELTSAKQQIEELTVSRNIWQDRHASELEQSLALAVRNAELEAEAARLREERDDLLEFKREVDGDGLVPAVRVAILDETEREVERLRKDEAIVDWLEANPFMAYRGIDHESGEPDDHFTLVDERKGLTHGRTGIVRPTFREAALAAMSERDGK